MCLIVVGWQAHADYPLVLAANRDEFYARPTAVAAHWPDAPQIIGGLDLEAGGTWLGISEAGRLAAVTNVREPNMAKGDCSRGALTRNFLLSDKPALEYAHHLAGSDYSGFNLLLGDGESLVYCSNRNDGPRILPPGIYGMSNHLLDSPWPKLVQARLRFTEALKQLPDEEAFFELLADRSIVADENLPQTGVPLDWERLLSAVFVKAESYGTRATTLLWQQRNGRIRLHEKSFGAQGEPLQSSVISTSL
jgi:uncharacterized protein with NRDE domain